MITATANELSVDTELSITVNETDRAPAFTAATTNTEQIIAEGDGLTAVVAEDPDGQTVTYALKSGTLPPNITLNTDGTFSGTAAYTSTGSYPVVITATANGLSVDTELSITVNETDRYPAFTAATTNTEQIIAEGDGLTAVVAEDPDGQTVTYALKSGTLPPDITLNTNGTFSGTAAYSSAGGPYTVVITATANGLTVDTELSITVNETDRAPAFTAATTNTEQIIAEGDGLTAVVAEDPDGQTVTYALKSGTLPPDITLNTNGTFSGTAAYSSAGGPYTVVITATANGLTVDTELSITVNETDRAPAFTAATTNTEQIIAEGDGLTAVVALDPDGQTVTYALKSGTLPPDITLNTDGTFSGTAAYTSTGSYPVVITATANGLSVDTELSITVNETDRYPAFTAATTNTEQIIAEGDGLTAVVALDPDGQTVSYALKSGTLPPDITLNTDGTFSGTAAYTSTGSYPVVITATANDLSVDTELSITVNETDRAPAFTAATTNTEQIIAEGDGLTAVVALDPDGQTVSYALKSGTLPPDITLNTDGTFSGTAAYTSTGSYPVVITATANDLSVDTELSITVNETDRAPAFTAATTNTEQIIAEGDGLTAVVALDPDGQTVSYALKSGTLPPDITLNTDGTFSGTAAYTSTGSYPVVITATANDLSVDTELSITVNETDRAPAFTAATTNTEQIIAEGDGLTAVVALDPDGQTVSYALKSGTLPPNITLNTDGTFSGTAAYSSAGGPYPVVITATANGLSVDTELSITVNDVPRELSISLTPSADINVAEQEPVEVSVTANDPEETSVTIQIAGNPDGSSWSTTSGSPASGTFTWTPDYDAADGSPYKIIFTAVSGERTVKDSITINVSDVQRDLVLSLPATEELTVAEGGTFSFTFGGTDPDGGTVQLSAAGLPQDASFDPATGEFSWTTGYTDAGTYPVGFTATVPEIKDSTKVLTLTVNNTNRAPSISHIYDFTVSIEEGSSEVLQATVSDPDTDDELSVTASIEPEGLPASVSMHEGTAQVTLSPGHDLATTTQAAEFEVTLIVHDGTADVSASVINVTVTNKNRTPVMTEIPAQTVTEGKTLAIQVEATDEDGDDLYLRVVNRPLNAAVVDSELTFTWETAQNDVGEHTLEFQVWDRRVYLRPARAADIPEMTSQEVVVTVVDTNYAPTIQPIPDVETQVGETMTLTVQGSDHDGDSLTYSDDTDLFDIDEKTGRISYTPALTDTLPGEYVITITAEDRTELRTSIQFNLTVTKDSTPPYIVGQPQAQGITTRQATVIWNTNERATSVVRYGIVGGPRDQTVSLDELVTRHVVTLSGLDPNTTYTYDVRSWDDVENPSTVREGSFKTLDEVVTTPLTIVGAPYVDRGDNYAIVTWQTNRYSSSVVNYGTTTTLGTQVTGEDNSEHRVTVSGLQPGTKYFYRVSSTDADNISASSEIDSFRTKSTLRPVVITRGPQVPARSDSSFTVSWNTDRAAISILEYGSSSAYGRQMTDSTLKTTHVLTITGLDPATEYHYRAGSNGPEELFENTYSADKTVYTMDEPDLTPPVITEGPSVPIRNHVSATVSWKTDELANSIVYYAVDEATTSGYTHTATRSDYTNDHDVNLSNLSPSTTYRYKVESYDVPGNPPSSKTGTFTTTDAPDETAPVLVTGSVRIVSVTDQSATVGWVTDERSDSWVIYQSDNGTDEVIVPDLATTHNVPLTGLEPKTRYNLSIYSRDATRNLMGPVTTSFRTRAEPDTLAPVIVGAPAVEGQHLNETTNLVDVILTLSTDERSQVTARYGTSEAELTGQVTSPDRSTNHTIRFTNLPAGTDIYYELVLTDFAEVPNVAVEDVRSFRTREGADRTSPRLSGITVVDVQTNNFTVQWQTDECATGVLQYGTAANDLNQTVENLSMKTTHILTATNLDAGTKYFWRVSSTDASNNRTPSGLRNVTTHAEADNTPPVFTVEPIPSYTSDQILVMVWETDEKTICKVYVAPVGSDEYSVYYSYGGSTQGGTEHNIRIVNLVPGTEYVYFVLASDGAGNIALTGNYESEEFENVPIDLPPGRVARRAGGRTGTGSFGTSPDSDTQFPVITSAPSVAGISPTSATVTWQTDETANSVVRILDATDASGRAARSSASVGETLVQTGRPVTLSEDVKDHVITITELSPNTRYVFHVASTDPSDNGETISDVVYMTTPSSVDLEPPVIEGSIVTSGNDVQQVISWETNELADSKVEFGTSASALSTSRYNANSTKEHNIVLTNLTAGTQYFFRVLSTDMNGNGPVASAVQSFTTSAAADQTPPVIVGDVNVINVTDRSATIQWTTDEPSDTYVEYGLTKSYGNTFVNTTVTTEHSVTFTNLLRATTYYFSITSTDISNNISEASPVDSLVTGTEADVTGPDAPAKVDTISASNRAVLRWARSVSADAAGYVVYRDGLVVTSGVADTLYVDKTVANGTRYTYQVSAVDFSGNEGAKTAAVSVTPSADEAPTAPGLLSPTGDVVFADMLTFQVNNASRATSRPDDPLTYSFVVSSDSLLANVVASASGVTEGNDGTTEWSVEGVSLESDIVYYWAAQANDGVTAGALSEVEDFTWGATSIELGEFTATAHQSGAVQVAWALQLVGGELNSVVLLRGEQNNDAEVVGSFGSEGIEGRLIDRLSAPGMETTYWLRVVYDRGEERVFGPVTAEAALPAEWALSNAYPNPFNPATTIQLSVPALAQAEVMIYNILGQPVRTLLSGHITPGVHQLIWNGRDELGRSAASGVYIVRLQTSDGFRQIKRITLVR